MQSQPKSHRWAPVATVLVTILATAVLAASDGRIPVWVALCPAAALFTYMEPLCGLIAPLAFMIICGTNLFGSVKIANVHFNATDWIFFGVLAGLAPRLKDHLRLPRPAFHQLGLLACATLLGVWNTNQAEFIRGDVRALLYIPLGAWLAFNLVRTPKALETMMKCLYWSTAAAALKAIYIAVAVPTSEMFLDAWQTYNTLNPQLGGKRVILVGADFFFVFGLPAAILLWTTALRRSERFVMAAGGMAILFALTASLTRSNWAMALVLTGTAIFYVIGKQKRRLAVLVLTLPLAACAVAFLPSIMMPESRFDVSDLAMRRLSADPSSGSSSLDESNYRIFESRLALDRLGDSWLVGCGTGCAYFTFVHPGVWDATPWSHNGWLWLAMKVGVIGFLVLGWQFMHGLRRLYAVGTRKSRHPNPCAFLLLLTGIGIIVLSTVLNRISYPECGLLMGCIVGLGANLDRLPAGVRGPRRQAPALPLQTPIQ